jgi:ribosomal protein S18 acetylase RimI-like enzyme
MEIEIRPLISEDLPALTRIDHSYHTDFVWQMALEQEESKLGIQFREIKLPRSMRVDYPWPEMKLADDWEQRDGVLVALHEDVQVGYISILKSIARPFATISDLVVIRRSRRQGIGTALLQAASGWLTQQGVDHLQLEMQSKNHPAISLAKKLGYEYCGYSDHYYPNLDIALFFSKRI